MPPREGNRNQGAVSVPSQIPHIIPSSSSAALKEYFRKRGGSYNASNPAWQEFRRLARECHWGNEIAEEKDDFKKALVLTFNGIFGTNEHDLGSWTRLCRVLRITPMPEDLMACQKAIQSLYVNIVDLIDNYHTGKPVRLFATELELSKYTRRSRKYFPKEHAHAGGLLKSLLRHIKSPRTEPGARGTRRRHRWH